MKWWSKIAKPLETPEIDADALKKAQDHVAEQRAQTERRWDDVRAITSALRVRSDRNNLAEAILAGRRQRRGHA